MNLFTFRATDHLESIIERLVKSASSIGDKAAWLEKILYFIREVVASVDPDVRAGDSLDIREFVKFEIIPGKSISICWGTVFILTILMHNFSQIFFPQGGTMEENAYIDGVVFLKNVTQKKMAIDSTKCMPRILVLAGSIDFQRTDDSRFHNLALSFYVHFDHHSILETV